MQPFGKVDKLSASSDILQVIKCSWYFELVFVFGPILILNSHKNGFILFEINITNQALRLC